MWNDVLLTGRALRRQWRFAAGVAITLGLGISVSSVVFAAVRATLYAPLPFPDASQLVWIGENGPDGRPLGTSFPLARLWTRDAVAMQTAGEYASGNATLTERGDPEVLAVAYVGGQFFETLGARPTIGRWINAADARESAEPVIVISDEMWRVRYGRSAQIIDQRCVLNDVAFRVVGVMPPAFDYPSSTTSAWIPIARTFAPFVNAHDVHLVSLIGRLRQGRSPAHLADELNDLSGAALGSRSGDHRANRVRVVDLRTRISSDIRPALLLLSFAAALVLGLACANALTLMFVRTLVREFEYALRSALGAPAKRLLRLALVENGLLVTLAGIVGFLIAVALSWVVRQLRGNTLPELGALGLGTSVSVGGVACALGVVAVCLLAPAFRVLRSTRYAALSASGPTGTGGKAQARLREGLVAFQLAVSLMLISQVGAVGSTFVRLLRENPGFDPRHVLVARVNRPYVAVTPTEAAEIRQFTSQMLAACDAVPSVRASAATTMVPTSTDRWIVQARAVGGVGSDASVLPVGVQPISPRYFEVLGIPIVGGRAFTPFDDDRSSPVVILDHAAARRFFGAGTPLGRHMYLTDLGMEVEVVGVVGDVARIPAREDDPPQVYLPLARVTLASIVVVLRTSGAASSVAPTIHEVVRRIDPQQPVVGVQPLVNIIAARRGQAIFFLSFFGVFAALSVCLTAVGVYAITAMSVVQRRRELAIRAALGGTPTRMVKTVMLSNAGIVARGLIGGLLLTVWMMRLVDTVIAALGLNRVFIVTVSAALVAFVVAVAAFVPAFRAAGVNPLVALREQ